MLSGVKHPFPEDLCSLFVCKCLCVLVVRLATLAKPLVFDVLRACNHKNCKYSGVCRTPYFENIFTFL